MSPMPPGNGPQPPPNQQVGLTPANQQDVAMMAQTLGLHPAEVLNELIQLGIITANAERLSKKYATGLSILLDRQIPNPPEPVPVKPEDVETRSAEEVLRELKVAAGIEPAPDVKKDEDPS